MQQPTPHESQLPTWPRRRKVQKGSMACPSSEFCSAVRWPSLRAARWPARECGTLGGSQGAGPRTRHHRAVFAEGSCACGITTGDWVSLVRRTTRVTLWELSTTRVCLISCHTHHTYQSTFLNISAVRLNSWVLLPLQRTVVRPVTLRDSDRCVFGPNDQTLSLCRFVC